MKLLTAGVHKLQSASVYVRDQSARTK